MTNLSVKIIALNYIYSEMSVNNYDYSHDSNFLKTLQRENILQWISQRLKYFK